MKPINDHRWLHMMETTNIFILLEQIKQHAKYISGIIKWAQSSSRKHWAPCPCCLVKTARWAQCVLSKIQWWHYRSTMQIKEICKNRTIQWKSVDNGQIWIAIQRNEVKCIICLHWSGKPGGINGTYSMQCKPRLTLVLQYALQCKVWLTLGSRWC